MTDATTWSSAKGIPVRNLWFLLVHASKLAVLMERSEAGADGDAEVPDLLARLLAEAVERRLRRGLGRGYVPHVAAVTRVRGRIDWLTTESRLQLSRGLVTCRFQDLTLDRPRNRLARAALTVLAGRVADASLASRLRSLDRDLALRGVGAERPPHAAIGADAPSAREFDDRLMVEAAQLALDLVLPAEAAEGRSLTRLSRDERLLRRIFEQGVAGFLRHRLHGRDGWKVAVSRALNWQTSEPTIGLAGILPNMVSDIVAQRDGRRLVIDTKFTSMTARNRYGADKLKSGHIYQLYAYLRSQETKGPVAAEARGMLLYPTLEDERSEGVTIDGHRLLFTSIDLRKSNVDLGARLEAIVKQGVAVED